MKRKQHIASYNPPGTMPKGMRETTAKAIAHAVTSLNAMKSGWGFVGPYHIAYAANLRNKVSPKMVRQACRRAGHSARVVFSEWVSRDQCVVTQIIGRM